MNKSKSVPEKETLTQAILRKHAVTLKEHIEAVREWLEKERKRLFIPTVSAMDCELSGAVDDTFEELLGNL